MTGELAAAGALLSIATLAVCFDGLIWREYLIARDEWEADGEPSGVFWAPADLPLMDRMVGAAARNRLALKWLWAAPSWIREDTVATRLLRVLRIALPCGVACAALAVWLALAGQ